MSHVREVGGKEMRAFRLNIVKEQRRSFTQAEVVEEVTDLGLTVPNNLRRIAARAKIKERPDPTNIPGEVVMYMVRQRIAEQLEKGKERLREGNLTYAMENFLRSKRVDIEVQPQRWKRRQELL